MRTIITAGVFAAFAVAATIGGANAATGHWYCTGDGIKAWTSNMDMKDASGWTYSGDRAVYKSDGHCKKS